MTIDSTFSSRVNDTNSSCLDTLNMEEPDGATLIKLANSNQLTQFLHQCVDIIIGRKQTTDNDHYNTTGDMAWTPQEIISARNLIESFYKSYAFQDQFEPNLPGLSEGDNAQIKDCFEIRKSELQEAVIRECLLKSELPLVENLDWKLKWILGSSKLANISQPLLQLDLHCVQNDGNKTVHKTVNLEMNLEQLDHFISELENAKNVLNI